MQTEAATPFPRITRDPAVMGGKPCIRGLRVTVGMILGNLGDGVGTMNCSQPIPISNGRMCWRQCVTARGWHRSARFALVPIA